MTQQNADQTVKYSITPLKRSTGTANQKRLPRRHFCHPCRYRRNGGLQHDYQKETSSKCNMIVIHHLWEFLEGVHRSLAGTVHMPCIGALELFESTSEPIENLSYSSHSCTRPLCTPLLPFLAPLLVSNLGFAMGDYDDEKRKKRDGLADDEELEFSDVDSEEESDSEESGAPRRKKRKTEGRTDLILMEAEEDDDEDEDDDMDGDEFLEGTCPFQSA